MLGLGLDITKGGPIITSSAASLLFDDYQNPLAGYSLRKLKRTYSGPAVTVRRESDNQNIDVGFSGNQLDVTSLENFCSGTNGFVSVWYDQSGTGKHLYQNFEVYQPKIVSNGTTIKNNNKPAVEFEETDGQWMAVEQPYSVSNQFLITAVLTPTNNVNDWGNLFNGTTANDRVRLYQNLDTQVRLGGIIYTAASSFTIDSLNVLSYQRSASNIEAYTDGVQQLNTPNTNTWTNILYRVGTNHADPPVLTHCLSAKVSELLFWDIDTSRVGVESNINAFY